MNSKISVEEDLQWKEFTNMDNTARIEWYHQRRNHKMKNLPG
jgi:hypothetical protein